MKNVLTIIGAAILLLTYTLKEVVKEKTKDRADALRFAEAQYRSDLGLSTLQINDIVLRQIDQIGEINRIKQTQPGNQDYSKIIKNDEAVAQQLLGSLNSDFGSVARFIDSFPSGAVDLRQARDLLRPNVEKIRNDVSELLKPVNSHDWDRAVQVKLGIVMVGTQVIPVAVLGDQLLTRSKEVQEACDKLYRLSGWTSYFLYAVGVILALYANLSGIKGLAPD